MRVLVADDQAKVRSALRLVLEHELEDVEVTEASTVEALLSLAPSVHPDLVLLDWELPGAHVFEVIPRLRKTAPESLVVALSGRPEAREPALAGGADAFVSKGSDPEVLLAVIRALSRSPRRPHPLT